MLNSFFPTIMKLFTIATQQDHEIKTYNKHFIKLAYYTNEQCAQFLQSAKYYYIKLHGESESTDFNDNYSDSWTSYWPITLQNIVVKDGKFFGVVVCGNAKYDRDYIICTLNEPKAHWYDGSDYSSTSKDYYLQKYDLPECALDFAQAYHIAQVTNEYKKGNEGREDSLKQTYNYTHLLMADDVLVENGLAIGVKHGDRTYLLADPTTLIQTFTEQDKYVASRYYVKTFTLTKTTN